MVLFEFLMNKTKTCIVSSSSKAKKRAAKGKMMQLAGIFVFRERGSGLSLGFWLIRPLVFDGARRKVALRGEDYAWAPIWWSSNNSKR